MRQIKIILLNGKIIFFKAYRHKIQIHCPSCGFNAHSAVNSTALHQCRNRHMRCSLFIIAINLFARNSVFPEQIIEKHTSPGTALPIYVTAPCHIAHCGDIFRISFGNNKALHAFDPFYQSHLPAAACKQFFYHRNIVYSAFFIKQMNGSYMGFSAFQSHKPRQTSHMTA